MKLEDLGHNLSAMFAVRAASHGETPLLWAKRDGNWHPWTWAQVASAVEDLAAGMVALGLQPGERVLLVAENRPEWAITDLAVLRAGGITVPSYTTYTTDDYAFLLEHSEPTLVVAAGTNVLRHLLPAVKRAGGVRAVVLLDPQANATLHWPCPVRAYTELLELGRGSSQVDRGLRAEPDEPACFIYTSGTGGQPKGVVLSHRNIMANVRGAWGLLERYLPHERKFLSFLPLSHAYEHTVGQFLPIAIGGEIWYAEGVEHLSSNLLEVRPSVLPCVPRLFEVFRQRTVSAVERQGGARARLFWKAVELGTKRYENGGRLPLHLRPLDELLDRLVRGKIKARFGGKLTAMVCGGGPLNPEIGIFFTSLGIPVCHGYGQTETSPVVSVTPPWTWKLDTVGPPLEGVEVRTAADGEILVRGDLVMEGYWKDETATRDAIRDGWLHTGDVGEIDPQGYLRITDRKKDIIVLSGGDTVAPQRVEAAIVLEPEIAQAIVYGDRRPNLVALLVPSPETCREAAKAARLAEADPALAIRPELKDRLEAAMKRANARLPTSERVRRWAVRLQPFTVENGLMTPTLKLRRQLIYKEEARAFEGLYAAAKERAA